MLGHASVVAVPRRAFASPTRRPARLSGLRGERGERGELWAAGARGKGSERAVLLCSSPPPRPAAPPRSSQLSIEGRGASPPRGTKRIALRLWIRAARRLPPSAHRFPPAAALRFHLASASRSRRRHVDHPCPRRRRRRGRSGSPPAWTRTKEPTQ